MPKVLAKTSHTKSEMSDDNCGEKISNPSLKANLFPSLMRQVEDSKEMPQVENPEDTIYATDSDDNEAIPNVDSVSPEYSTFSTAFSRGEWTPPGWLPESTSDFPGQVLLKSYLQVLVKISNLREFRIFKFFVKLK